MSVLFLRMHYGYINSKYSGGVEKRVFTSQRSSRCHDRGHTQPLRTGIRTQTTGFSELLQVVKFTIWWESRDNQSGDNDVTQSHARNLVDTRTTTSENAVALTFFRRYKRSN